MIIVSSRKFRDSQNEYFELAKKEEVILKTLHYGNFRLVPIKEPKIATGKKKKVTKQSGASIYIPDDLIKSKVEAIEQISTKELEASKNDTQNNIEEQSPTPVVEEQVIIEKAIEEPIQESKTVSNIEEPKEIVEVAPEPIITATEEESEEIQEQEESLVEIEEKPQIITVSEKPEEKVEVDYISHMLHSTLNKTEEKPLEEEHDNSQKQTSKPADEEVIVKEEWKPGNVFVDPSLLTLEEVRIQEGLDEMNKKESFFTKLFKKKK